MKRIDNNTLTTIAIVDGIVSDMGCKTEMSDNGMLVFQYQGETFNLEFNGYNVRFWNPSWSFISANDPNMHKVIMAANLANVRQCPTIVYTEPNEENNIIFHSRRDMVIIPNFEGNRVYVEAVLNSFFQAHQEMHRIAFDLVHNSK